MAAVAGRAVLPRVRLHNIDKSEKPGEGGGTYRAKLKLLRIADTASY